MCSVASVTCSSTESSGAHATDVMCRAAYSSLGHDSLKNSRDEDASECFRKVEAVILHMLRDILCSFFDATLSENSSKNLNRRQRSGFDFVKAGVFQKEAEQRRLKVTILPKPRQRSCASTQMPEEV